MIHSFNTKQSVYIALVATALIALAGAYGVSYVFAANTATQEASTAQATTISVVAQSATSAVSTITFPEGAPGAVISDPYNNVDTSSSPQFLDSSASVPVVRLQNSSGGTLNVTLSISTWSNGVAASEDYELVDPGTTTTNAVTTQLSSDGNANTVATGVSIAASAFKALYLKLSLSGVANKQGTSTLTVLGETP